jgi:hypothetical protein
MSKYIVFIIHLEILKRIVIWDVVQCNVAIICLVCMFDIQPPRPTNLSDGWMTPAAPAG